MSNDANAYRLDPSSISRLFQLCDEPDEVQPAQQSDCQKSQLLRDLLADIPPLSSNVLAGIPEILRRLHRTAPRVQGRSLGQILQDPATSLAELRSVKEHAKGLVSKAKTEGEHEAAGVIYYAAIARALIRHGVRITQHSHEQLAESFTSLLTNEWIPSNLKDLFAKAGDASSRGSSEKPTPS